MRYFDYNDNDDNTYCQDENNDYHSMMIITKLY